MVPSQGCQDFIIDHHHGDKLQIFYISISRSKEMPEHRRDADRTSHVTRCCSKPPCFGRGEESVAEICFVQLGKTSRPRGEKPRLSNMFAFAFADTEGTQPRQKHMDGNRTEARCGGRGLRCVRHKWVPVVFRLHHDDGCNKQHGAAVCSAAGQAACFGTMFHGPWTWANNLSVKVQAQVCQNIFIGGRVWKTIWTKFIQSNAFSWWFGSTLL